MDYIFFSSISSKFFSRWEKFAWIEIFGRIRIRVQWIRIRNTALNTLLHSILPRAVDPRYFFRIRFQLFFSMRIRIQMLIRIQLKQVCKKITFWSWRRRKKDQIYLNILIKLQLLPIFFPFFFFLNFSLLDLDPRPRCYQKMWKIKNIIVGVTCLLGTRSCLVTPDTRVMLESRDSTGLKHILHWRIGWI